MFQILAYPQITLTGTNVPVVTVPISLIGTGDNSLGSGTFVNSGYKFRNIQKRTFAFIKNNSPFLNAYVRFITTRTIETLSIADRTFTLAPGSDTLFVGPFTNMFYTSGIIQGTTYNDFVQACFAHDSDNPVNLITFGVAYV